MTRQNTFLFSIITLLAIAATGCKKFVQVPGPDFRVVRSKVFSHDEAANAAVVDMYVQMQNGTSFTNGHGSKLAALYADELQPVGTASQVDQPFYNHLLTASSPACETFWSGAYTVIYLANALLEGLEASTTLTDSLRQQWMGEARFVRAMHYFYLTNGFGEVPLALTTSYITNRNLPRSPAQAVYRQILTDLQVAVVTLPIKRIPKEATQPGNIRPTRWAAMALLARVFLYLSDWQSARDMATQVIAESGYSLAAIDSVFLVHSREILFQLQPIAQGANSAEGALFLPAGGRPPFIATNTFLSRFEAADARKTAWLGKYVQGAETLYYPYKYRQRLGTPTKEYTVVLRLAEVYLIHAEASARLGILQGPAGALANLNAIRARAQLVPLPAVMEQQAVLAAVEQERAVELWAEWMHRLGDLTRWPGRQHPSVSRFREVMQVYRPGLQQYRELWPVPAGQLVLNASWQQNPGY